MLEYFELLLSTVVIIWFSTLLLGIATSIIYDVLHKEPYPKWMKMRNPYEVIFLPWRLLKSILDKIT